MTTTPAGSVQLNLRVSAKMADDLDAWVEEINSDGRWPKINRTDVLRALIEYGLAKRPDWIAK